ncbi:MAG: hypothetical protein QOJ33_1748 [Chloroflexota bacterium]|jgi:hypothetical protein|nr:hypothetical protein [Chloroflexota bacterium]
MRPATAISLIALFVALGGTGYATIALPKNSVTTKQVKDRSLMTRDFKQGQIPQGPRGPQGLNGTNGAPGAQGAAGTAGIANITELLGNAVGQCGSGGGGCQVASARAACPSGQVAIGGGYHVTGIDQVIAWSARTSSTEWGVIAVNYDSSGQSVTAHVTCASGPGVTATAARTSAFLRAAKQAKASMP